LFKLKENAIGNKEIQRKTSVRYLGILLDERLLFNSHIETQLNKAKKVFISHRRLFYSKILNSKVKLMLSITNKTDYNVWLSNLV